MSVFLTYFLNGNPTLVYGQFSMLISLPVPFPFVVLSLALSRKTIDDYENNV